MLELKKLQPGTGQRVRELFKNHKRVDLAVESITEGQTGKNIRIFVNDEADIQVIQLVQASFTIFAGDSTHPTARAMVEDLPPFRYIMPVPEDWMQVIKEIHSDKLKTAKRYSFSSANLAQEHLRQLLESHAYREFLCRIDLALAREMALDNLNKFHLVNYESPEHFVEKGFGYCVQLDDKVVAACSSGLVCQKGVEICVITQPEYREKGLATLVAAQFILHCLENNLHPNWDAANLKSVNLAQKLGYSKTGEYEIYFIEEK